SRSFNSTSLPWVGIRPPTKCPRDGGFRGVRHTPPDASGGASFESTGRRCRRRLSTDASHPVVARYVVFPLGREDASALALAQSPDMSPRRRRMPAWNVVGRYGDRWAQWSRVAASFS